MPFDDLLAMHQDLRRSPVYKLYYRSYKTSDGAIMVGCLSDHLRKRLNDALGNDDPRFDPDYDTSAPEYAELLVALTKKTEERFLTQTSAEWTEFLQKAGVPVGPVRFAEELADNPQAIANNIIVEQDDPANGRVKTVGSIYKMSETPPEAIKPAPQLGAHTDEIMAEIGYTPDEITDLRNSGAFG